MVQIDTQEDQLSKYLSEHYRSYITSFDDVSILLWQADQHKPYLFTIIVGMDYRPFEKVEFPNNIWNRRYVQDYRFKNIIEFAKALANKRDFVCVIGFPRIEEYKANSWEGSEKKYPQDQVRFIFAEITGNKNDIKHYSGHELRKQIHSKLGVNNSDNIKTAKSLNKHLADYFQYWSRTFLATRITKLDIDGGFFVGENNEKILIEIKRSNRPPLYQWRPYIADKANYALEYEFCKRNEIYFWLLHHTGTETITSESKISFFEINDVKRTSDSPSDFLRYNNNNTLRILTMHEFHQVLTNILKQGENE